MIDIAVPEEVAHDSYHVLVTDHRIESEALFAGKNELLIVHQGQSYRLRVTSNKKLILIK